MPAVVFYRDFILSHGFSKSLLVDPAEKISGCHTVLF
jgi:hypothetical protein